MAFTLRLPESLRRVREQFHTSSPSAPKDQSLPDDPAPKPVNQPDRKSVV